MKLILEFDSMKEMAEWAMDLCNNPGTVISSEIVNGDKLKAVPEEKVKPAAASGGTVKGDLIAEIKAQGVKLADAERYEGVEGVMKKFGVVKLKDIKPENQEEALKMITKMLGADDAKYKAMLAALK